MKKYIFLLFASLCMMACSDDDQQAEAQPSIPNDSRYLSKVLDENGDQIMSFSYNSDKTLRLISSTSEGVQLRYEYENGNISRTYFTIEGNILITDFQYVNGVLNSFTQDNVTWPVEYIEQNNSYVYSWNDINYQIFLTPDHDIKKIIQEDLVYEQYFELNFFYEPGYGCLHNINPISLQSLLGSNLLISNRFMLLNLSNKPMESTIINDGSLNYENTYDEENRLIQSEVTIVGEDTQISTIKYEYIAL